MFFGEISNPFNLRRQIYEAHEQNKLSMVCAGIFITVFVPVRSVVCSWVVRFIQLSPITSKELKVIASIMLLVGFIWIWHILLMVFEKIGEGKPKGSLLHNLYVKSKAAGKYSVVWYAVSVLASIYWLVWSTYYDIAGWPHKYHLKSA